MEITDELKARIAELYISGMSGVAIARRDDMPNERTTQQIIREMVKNKECLRRGEKRFVPHVVEVRDGVRVWEVNPGHWVIGDKAAKTMGYI